MNEKDLLEQLKETAHQITPPDSLSPEAIETMLKTQTKDPASQQTAQSPDKQPARKKRISVYRLGGLAAAFAVVIAVSWQAGHLSATRELTSQTQFANEPSGNQDTPEDLLLLDQELISEVGEVSDSPAQSAAERTDTDASAPDHTGEENIKEHAAASDDTQEEYSLKNNQTDDNTSVVPDSRANKETRTADPAKAEAETENPIPMTASLKPVESYETVYEALKETFGQQSLLREETLYDTGFGVNTLEIAADTEATPQLAAGSSNAPDYSTTNLQEAGVDEGDIVKTDGEYIYILRRSGSLEILSAKDGSMEIVSHLTFSPEETVQEMYLDNDRLSVITSGYYTEMENSNEDVISAKSGSKTHLYTYDISVKNEPKLLGSVTQDGGYQQSRKNGNYIYLFTHFSPAVMETYEESHLAPATSKGELDASSIYLPEHLNHSSYLVAASVNIQEPDQIVDHKAVVSVGSAFYASQENIYIANENWDSAATQTEILKLHYEDGIITGIAAGSVEGYVNDSFSLNEYNGYLRMVTTSYDEDYNESNGLYILDPNLKLVGAIKDLAPGETVRSARFMGDTGYFVTFRQTDPLFSVDLSDPAAPKVLGNLKVSGFSSYLHFYSEDLLLGLGYEADENTGTTTGLKLSMFDISDPANVTEVDKLVINGITWCDSLNDYKSILIDPEKNIFGFSCDNRYLVFSYDEEKGFQREFIYDFYNDLMENTSSEDSSDTSGEATPDSQDPSLPDTDTTDTANADNNGQDAPNDELMTLEYIEPGTWYDPYADTTTRGLYIHNTLYLVRPGLGIVTSFDMTDEYRQIEQLQLQ